MEHQEKCDGCGDIFPESQVRDLGPPSMLVLCGDCEGEYGEYMRAKDKFDRESGDDCG